jgi:hypothetical protein
MLYMTWEFLGFSQLHLPPCSRSWHHRGVMLCLVLYELWNLNSKSSHLYTKYFIHSPSLIINLYFYSVVFLEDTWYALEYLPLTEACFVAWYMAYSRDLYVWTKEHDCVATEEMLCKQMLRTCDLWCNLGSGALSLTFLIACSFSLITVWYGWFINW